MFRARCPIFESKKIPKVAHDRDHHEAEAAVEVTPQPPNDLEALQTGTVAHGHDLMIHVAKVPEQKGRIKVTN